MINDPNKTILITGGAGFIGQNLTKYLLKQGFKIKILDSLNFQIHGKNPFENKKLNTMLSQVEFVHGDVTSLKDVRRSLKGVQIVIHLASETGTGQSMYQVSQYVKTNVLGTSVLLEGIAEKKSKLDRFILASSRAVYGEGKYYCKKHRIFFPENRCEEHLSKGQFEILCPKCNEISFPLSSSEESKLNPSSIYGINKLNQEQLTLNICKNLNINCTILRLQNVYGPGQSITNPYTGIISIFSSRILTKKDIFIFEDGKESRDFIFIDDVIEVFSNIVNYEKKVSHVLNVGTGVATDLISLVKNLGEALKIKPIFSITGQYRLGDIRHNFADINKLSNTLNLSLSTSLIEGLQKFSSWVKHQKLEEDNYEYSLDILHKKGLLK